MRLSFLLIILSVLLFSGCMTTSVAVVPDEINISGLSTDLSTDSLLTIDYPHHEIHSGSSFTYSDTHEIAKNGVIEHLIITPNTTKQAHFTISIGSTGGKVKFEVFEDTITSNDGDIEPLFNRNRNSVKSPTTILYENPVLVNDGTRIIQQTFGIKDKKSSGGGGRGTNEWILKQNTKYLFRVEELNVAATAINLQFDWYEHTSKYQTPLE